MLFLSFDEVGGLLAHDGSGLGNHGLLGILHGKKTQEAKMTPHRVWVGSERNGAGVAVTGPLPAPAPPCDGWGPLDCNGGCPVHSPARRVQ